MEEQLILKGIQEETPWDKLPKRLKLYLNTADEWHRRIKEHCIKKRLMWSECAARIACREHDYYEDLMRYLRKNQALFPYHLAEYVSRIMRVSPFRYYCDLVYEVMKQERSYDTIPNFTAADALRETGLGRNQFIDIMNKIRSKLMWKFSKSVVREMLPTQPAEFPLETWWTVSVVNITGDEFRKMEEKDLVVVKKAGSDTGAVVGEFEVEALRSLYKRGFIYFDIPVYPYDRFQVKSLEGFVSNRNQQYEDYTEELLYAVFVASSELATVQDLAGTLQADISQLEATISLACRLGWAHKFMDPGGVLGQFPGSPIREGERGDDLDFGRHSPVLAQGPQPPPGVMMDLLNLDGPDVGDGAAAAVDGRGAESGRGPTRIAFLVDANLTSFLMMGSFSYGLKQQAVTLYEAGKLGDQAVGELCTELKSLEGGTPLEGELQHFANHALSLRLVLQCLRTNLVPPPPLAPLALARAAPRPAAAPADGDEGGDLPGEGALGVVPPVEEGEEAVGTSFSLKDLPRVESLSIGSVKDPGGSTQEDEEWGSFREASRVEADGSLGVGKEPASVPDGQRPDPATLPAGGPKISMGPKRPNLTLEPVGGAEGPDTSPVLLSPNKSPKSPKSPFLRVSTGEIFRRNFSRSSTGPGTPTKKESEAAEFLPEAAGPDDLGGAEAAPSPQREAAAEPRSRSESLNFMDLDIAMTPRLEASPSPGPSGYGKGFQLDPDVATAMSPAARGAGAAGASDTGFSFSSNAGSATSMAAGRLGALPPPPSGIEWPKGVAGGTLGSDGAVAGPAALGSSTADGINSQFPGRIESGDVDQRPADAEPGGPGEGAAAQRGDEGLAVAAHAVGAVAGKNKVEVLRSESLSGLPPVTLLRLLKRDYAVVVSMIPLSTPLTVMSSDGQGPVHLGPPSPLACTPWMKLLLYAVGGSGPLSIALVRGQRLRFLPPHLAGCRKALVWSWDGVIVGGVGGKPEGSLVPGSILLHVLNSILRQSAVLVQPFFDGSGSLTPRGALVFHDIPLPLARGADGRPDIRWSASEAAATERASGNHDTAARGPPGGQPAVTEPPAMAAGPGEETLLELRGANMPAAAVVAPSARGGEGGAAAAEWAGPSSGVPAAQEAPAETLSRDSFHSPGGMGSSTARGDDRWREAKVIERVVRELGLETVGYLRMLRTDKVERYDDDTYDRLFNVGKEAASVGGSRGGPIGDAAKGPADMSIEIPKRHLGARQQAAAGGSGPVQAAAGWPAPVSEGQPHDVAEDGGREYEWVVHGAEFGVPLFDTVLCRQVCTGALGAGMLEPQLLEEQRGRMHSLRQKLAEFVATYRANGKGSQAALLGDTAMLRSISSRLASGNLPEDDDPDVARRLSHGASILSPSSSDISLMRKGKVVSVHGDDFPAFSPARSSPRQSFSETHGSGTRGKDPPSRPRALADEELDGGEAAVLPGTNLIFDGALLAPYDLSACLQGRFAAQLVAEATATSEQLSQIYNQISLINSIH